MFDITLTGNPFSPSGSGTFTTDGICTTCMPGDGLLSLTINIGPDSGTQPFDISDDFGIIATYVRSTNSLDYMGRNSETGDTLHMIASNSNWSLVPATGDQSGIGTFSVTPTPEPSSLFLLIPVVALVGLRWRHQRHRA